MSMETTRLKPRVVQVVVQLAGAVKRHVVKYTTLHNLAVSIESKAIRSYSSVQEFGCLDQVPSIQSALFTRALKDLNDIQQDLKNALSLIESNMPLGLFLQASVLSRILREVDSKLIYLELLFLTIGNVGSMISSMQSEMRTLFLEALISSDCEARNSERIHQFLQKVESETRAFFGNINDSIMKNEARIAFAMGLAKYGDREGKASYAFRPLHTDDLHSAARFFTKACRLGVREAYRHLGDLYYEGHGVEVCYHKAVELYRKGAERSDAAAKFKLGWCYEFGHGVDKDGEQCVKLFREAVDGGSGEAMAELGYLKLNGKIVPSDHSGAYRLLKKAEKLGVFITKESLAVCYEKGIGEDRDPVKAFQMYRESFDGGFLLTTARLAHCYDTGSGVRRDPREATKVLERCVNSGTWHSDFNKAYLGLRLIQGNGVEKDVARGKAIIVDSTKSGSAITWNALGDCFRHGIGFRKDIRKAKEFYEKAIESGSGARGVVSSYEAMGEIFEFGDGVTASIIRANKYYVGAADRLSSIGQWKIATAFENGIGIKKNIHRAVYYFRLCGNSGIERAQRKSAMYYMKGHGVERPRTYIRKIIEEAARGGSKEAKKWLKTEKSNSVDQCFKFNHQPESIRI